MENICRQVQFSENSKAAIYKTGQYATPEAKLKRYEKSSINSYNAFAKSINQNKYAVNGSYRRYVDKKLLELTQQINLPPPETEKADAPTSALNANTKVQFSMPLNLIGSMPDNQPQATL